MEGKFTRMATHCLLRRVRSRLTYTVLRALIVAALFIMVISYSVHFHSWTVVQDNIRTFTDKYPGSMRNLAGHYSHSGQYFGRTHFKGTILTEHNIFENLPSRNLSTGGQKTVTTKRHMNENVTRLKGHIFSHKDRLKQATNQIPDVNIPSNNRNVDLGLSGKVSANQNHHDMKHLSNQHSIRPQLSKGDQNVPKQSMHDRHYGNWTIDRNQTTRPTNHEMPEQFSQLDVQPKVLLAADPSSVFTARSIAALLESQRIGFDIFVQTGNKTPPALWMQNTDDKIIGKYSLMIFANYAGAFYTWPKSTRTAFRDYSKLFGVTMVGVAYTPKNLSQPDPGYMNTSHFILGDLITHSVPSERVKFLELNPKRDFYILKNGGKIFKVPTNIQWHMFLPIKSLSVGHVTDTMATELDKESETIAKSENLDVLATITYQTVAGNFNPFNATTTSPLVLVTKGLNSGVRKVLIGSPITFWLTKLMMFEILKKESLKPLMRFGTERSVLVDIDDIFVAPEGKKMNVSDVQALIKAQEHYRNLIPGFTFNLGFCGNYFKRGTPSDIQGSQELIRQRNHFWWFGHTYNHYQPHKHSVENLTRFMAQNVEFALNHSLPVFDNHYSVSPHHSGVYPIHQPLYYAWKKVWNVTVTSTEEYPHLRPDFRRRGFIHDGVMVLPRQTCCLFTHTYSYETFKGGKSALRGVAEGGEVFTTILYNPISIFMTHVTNYAIDRLALNLFDRLFEFVRQWTKLNLTTDRPLNLARKYFELFPEEKMPVWTSPCNDRRHLEIWAKTKNCSRFPNLIILGPQKTGSTALHSFLKIHPSILSNHQTKEHFEETQFFSSDVMYKRGIDWYMNQFPVPNEQTVVLFEKSATYFTNTLALKRIHALLPKIKLIVILVDPAKRAYSWYQHMRAHKDPTSMKYSFSEVIHSSTHTTTDKRLLALKDKCLTPGRYHVHIKKWLTKFSSMQLLPVDGEELVERPASVLDVVQNFTGVVYQNYSKLLSYNAKKGFHCINTVEGKNQCLGPSKGRHYQPLALEDGHYLEEYYKRDNVELLTLLKKHLWTVPKWLNKPPA